MKPRIDQPRGEPLDPTAAGIDIRPLPRAPGAAGALPSPGDWTMSPVRAPSPLRMLLSVPLALALYYFRWLILARVGGLDGDIAARARRWARWERRYRPSPEGENMAQIDYWTSFFLWKRWRRRTAISMLTLPVHAGVGAYRAAAELGKGVMAAHSRSILAQALEIWLLALRYPVTYGSHPRLYYLNEVFDPARRGDAPYVLSDVHQTVLALALNGRLTGSMHKGGFAVRCAELQLPHIPTIAEVRPDGRITWLHGSTGLPAEDLFSKPTAGMKGIGAARWLWQGGGRYRAESGELLDAAAVMAELRSAARHGAVVVQRRLRNHPEIEALVGSTLATIRVQSIITSGGRFEAVLALHRSAPRDAAVNNGSQGGVACPVDLGTGRLGRLMINEGEAGIQFSPIHPRTGMRIEGTYLPLWSETLALVERAHLAFDQHPVLGWDVAVTAEGPVLVEPNPAPGAQAVQAVNRLALGRTRYMRQLLELLERSKLE